MAFFHERKKALYCLFNPKCAQPTTLPVLPVADPDLLIGGPGHPDPEIRGVGGAPSQNFFSAVRASVSSENKGGPGPSLDPPLIT